MVRFRLGVRIRVMVGFRVRVRVGLGLSQHALEGTCDGADPSDWGEEI